MKIKSRYRKILICATLLSSILLIGFLSNIYFQNNNLSTYNNENSQNLNFSAGKQLPYSAIYQNNSLVISLFESINFTVDTSSFKNVSYTTLEINFNDNSTAEYNMTRIGATNNFTIAYTPDYSVPTGEQNVTFGIYDQNNILLNTRQTHTNFTVISNYYSADFNKDKYYRSDSLYSKLFLKNISGYQFSWYTSIVDSTNEGSQNVLIDEGYGKNYVNFIISKQNFKVLDKNYYIKMEIEDIATSKTANVYFPFYVANSDPIIIANSTNLNPTSVFREKTCELSFNVTDKETNPVNITTTVKVTDPYGALKSYSDITNNGDGSFNLNFTIAKNEPIGRYQIEIIAFDQNDGSNTYTTYLNVKNNLPKINSYTVNGFGMNESVSVLYGKDIVFKFNISDVDDNIAFVTVALINENGQWFNITRKYSSDLEISIRSIDLVTGNWYVYISATDTDGGTVNLTTNYNQAPQEIRIVPDIIGLILPWITLITGLILGGLIGIAIAYNVLKARQKTVKPLEKEKRVKKPKIEKEPKEEPKEVKEPEAEEKVEEKSTPRKIKRKL
ncbi:MAG: hypothetical protein P8Y70_04910 [Candidatus Lokiarchaeota archaeon]